MHDGERAKTGNIGYEQELPWSMNLRTGYNYRRLSRGFTYQNQVLPGDLVPPGIVAGLGSNSFDAVYMLANDRRDVFDSFEVTLRQTLRKQYGWMASYTRCSRPSSITLPRSAASAPPA